MTSNNVTKFVPKDPKSKIPNSKPAKTLAQIKTRRWLIFLGAFVFVGALISNWNASDVTQVSHLESYQSISGDQVVVAAENRYGHYVVEGEINGHAVTFIVDTGATTIAIPENIATKIGLKKGKQFYASTAGGKSLSYTTYIDKVSIGSIEKRNMRAVINSASTDDLILLGMNFLQDLQLEQSGGKLTLKKVNEN